MQFNNSISDFKMSFYVVHICQTVGMKSKEVKKEQTSPCVFSRVSKTATCPGITCLLLQAAAPSPPASNRKSSAGLGWTECGVLAVFPKVWTNGWSSSLSLRPANIWWFCSAAPPPSEAPSARAALLPKNTGQKNRQWTQLSTRQWHLNYFLKCVEDLANFGQPPF